MSNPDVQIATLNAEQTLAGAQAALVTLTTTLHTQSLSQEGVVATTNTQYVQAKQDAMAADTLLAKKLISPFDYNNKKAAADELTQRLRGSQKSSSRSCSPRSIRRSPFSASR